MRVHFGDLTLDAGTRQLLRGTEEIHLSPKAFDLLKFLVENRPRVIAKTELHEHLWPATFVSEANLASLIAEIRQALGDDARRPQFVRTAHRFGYAFCATALDSSDLSVPALPFGSAWLVVKGRRIPLRDGENILGREPGEGTRLDSPTVSRRHACILVTGTDATLEDLGSKNGTLLRGDPVSAAVRLSDGDEIRVGSVVLTFRMRSGPGSTQTSD